MKHAFSTWAVTVFLAATSVVGQQTPPEDSFEALEAVVPDIMEDGQFPGVAIAVTRHGVPIHVSVHGIANISNQDPVTTQTVFEIASLTKQMTALAIMTLVEEEKLSLSDPITKFIQGVPDGWANITVDQLLANTAGLTHRFEQLIDGAFLLEYTKEGMLESAMATPMIAEPGTDWNYSDQGYFLLGLIIEAASGSSYAEFMHDRFFGPLGMDQTHLLDQRRIVPYAAQGYAVENGRLQRNRRVCPTSFFK